MNFYGSYCRLFSLNLELFSDRRPMFFRSIGNSSEGENNSFTVAHFELVVPEK